MLKAECSLFRVVSGTYLVLSHSCEAEHANLVGDVLPVPGGSLLSKTIPKTLSHSDDAISHPLDIYKPLLSKKKRTEYLS